MNIPCKWQKLDSFDGGTEILFQTNMQVFIILEKTYFQQEMKVSVNKC